MPEIKGHRRFIGGRRDGHVDRLVYAHPSDYPLFIQYPDGSFYERESLDGGTEAVYRYTAQFDGGGGRG